jgi:hypothetical protein
MRKVLFCITGFVIVFFSCEKTISEFQSAQFIKFLGGGMGSSGYDALELAGEGFLITGYDATSLFRRQVLVTRTDKSGNTLWKKLYGTEHNEEGKVVKLSGNDILIAGNSTNFITGKINGFVLKLDMQGDSIAFYPVSSDKSNIVINDMAIHNGLVYLAGEEYQSVPSASKYFVACLKMSGEIGWKRSIGTSDRRQSFNRIYIKDNGNILATGTTNGIIGCNLTRISVTELNSLGVAVGCIHLASDVNQEFGNAYYDEKNLYILHGSTRGGAMTSHITCITSGSTVRWTTDQGMPGKGSAMIRHDDNKFLVATENDDKVSFYSLMASGSGNAEITELKSYPGSVSTIISTGDKGVLFAGSTSRDYGSKMRIIKTCAGLYLLQP